MLSGITRPPQIEILYFDGCPNHEAAQALVERVVAEVELDTTPNLVEVPDPETAAAMRFLGSPTVRVNGRDVEPGAGERTDYVLACRVYRGASGFSGQPDEKWVREALVEAMS
jgi:hypothetical protein